MNFTITVPEGSTNHGNPNLLCTPAKWYDLIVFFFANYFAHAASVIIEPGQSLEKTGLSILFALMLPGTGIARAIHAILRHAATETKNPLKRAARAGALCMVLKTPECGPYAQELSLQRLMMRRRKMRADLVVEVENCQTREKPTEIEAEQSTAKVAGQKPDDVQEISAGAITDEQRKETEAKSGSSTQSSGSHWWDPPGGSKPVPPGTAIHGEHWIHEDSMYYLAMVPSTASMQLAFDAGKDGAVTPEPEDQPKANLASSLNLLKLFISLIQAIWAIITIYRARGDQIQQYGYAAFGLTVAPYAFMSILNTLANMLTPDYPSMFLIRTPTMDKAEEDMNGFFKGAICVDVSPEGNTQERWIYQVLARVDNYFFSPETSDEEYPHLDPRKTPLYLDFFFGLVPLAIVGGLSGFQQGNSSQLERGFTMSWLVVGIISGAAAGQMNLALTLGMPNTIIFEDENVPDLFKTTLLYFAVVVAYGVPAIGGMIIVGMMIRNFGVCTLIG